jgi:hypothetical protein
MLWIATFFVALLLSASAAAYPVGKISTPTTSMVKRPEAHYLQDAPFAGENGVIAAASEPVVIEVTVWVDKHGRPLSTETHSPTKTVARVSTEALEHMPNQYSCQLYRSQPASLPF